MNHKSLQLLLSCLCLWVGCGKNNIHTIQSLEGSYCGSFYEKAVRYPSEDVSQSNLLFFSTLTKSPDVHGAFIFLDGPLKNIAIKVYDDRLKFEHEEFRFGSSQGSPHKYETHYHYIGQGEIINDNQIELSYTLVIRYINSDDYVIAEGTMTLLPSTEATQYQGKFAGMRSQLEIVSQNDSLLSSGSFITLSADTIHWQQLLSFSSPCKLTTPFTDSVSQQLQRHLNVIRTGETFLLQYHDLGTGIQTDTLYRLN